MIDNNKRFKAIRIVTCVSIMFRMKVIWCFWIDPLWIAYICTSSISLSTTSIHLLFNILSQILEVVFSRGYEPKIFNSLSIVWIRTQKWHHSSAQSTKNYPFLVQPTVNICQGVKKNYRIKCRASGKHVIAVFICFSQHSTSLAQSRGRPWNQSCVPDRHIFRGSQANWLRKAGHMC